MAKTASKLEKIAKMACFLGTCNENVKILSQPANNSWPNGPRVVIVHLIYCDGYHIHPSIVLLDDILSSRHQAKAKMEKGHQTAIFSKF